MESQRRMGTEEKPSTQLTQHTHTHTHTHIHAHALALALALAYAHPSTHGSTGPGNDAQCKSDGVYFGAHSAAL